MRPTDFLFSGVCDLLDCFEADIFLRTNRVRAYIQQSDRMSGL